MGPPMGAPHYAPKKGPPIALFVGAGCGLFAVIGVIVLVVLVLVARSPSASADDTDSPRPSSDDDGQPSPQKEEPEADPMDGAVFKGIPDTNVEVPVPPGWREDRKSLYSFALSDDGDAVLAFTTVSSLGEFTGRLQHATAVFNIQNCTMKDAERVRLGPNDLRARLREGDCTFNGVPAHVAVVLVESGNALPLVIYAVDQKASKHTTTQAQQTILRMRLRP